jgi:hypothetical protein
MKSFLSYLMFFIVSVVIIFMPRFEYKQKLLTYELENHVLWIEKKDEELEWWIK